LIVDLEVASLLGPRLLQIGVASQLKARDHHLVLVAVHLGLDIEEYLDDDVLPRILPVKIVLGEASLGRPRLTENEVQRSKNVGLAGVVLSDENAK